VSNVYRISQFKKIIEISPSFIQSSDYIGPIHTKIILA